MFCAWAWLGLVAPAEALRPSVSFRTGARIVPWTAGRGEIGSSRIHNLSPSVPSGVFERTAIRWDHGRGGQQERRSSGGVPDLGFISPTSSNLRRGHVRPQHMSMAGEEEGAGGGENTAALSALAVFGLGALLYG